MKTPLSKSLVYRLLLLIVLITPLLVFSNKEVSRNVLYVSSFTPDNHWAKLSKEAMLHTFNHNGYVINIKEIYLDEKKYPKLENRIEKLKSFFRTNKEKIDIILAFDYGATDLFLKYSDSIINKIPIIFVSELESGRKIDFKNVTGIVSDYGIGQVYKTGLKMFPNVHKVYVWADKSPTGIFFLSRAKNILSGYKDGGIDIEYGVDANSKKEFLNKVSSLDKRSFMIFGTWQVDDKGNEYLANDLYPQFIEVAKIPIFTVFDGYIGKGFAGGFVQLAESNAKAIAQKAIRIFNGEIPEKMSIDNIPPVPKYDVDNIIKQNGEFRVIPENSILLNQIEAFFNAHKIMVSLFGIIIVSLLILLFLRVKNLNLLRLINEREKHEKELELNIKLLSFAMPSLQTVTWKYDDREKKFLIGVNDGIGKKRVTEFSELTNILHFVEPSFREGFWNYLQSLLRAEEHLEFNYEFKATISEDESYSWWETRGIVEILNDKKGSYRVVYGIIFNIEKFKENEAKLNDALEKAIQSDNIKANFIANISHEIRTPLNAIIGFTNLIIQSDNKEEQQQYEEIILQNNENLLRLVNDIINLSELDSGYINFEEIQFDLHQYFDELENIFRHKLRKETELIIENPYDSCVVFLDKTKITRVIYEFMENAIKFTHKGSITLGYKIEDDNILFYVKDTGKGIKKEDLSKIYDRFEKLDSFEQGTGLGLSICKSIINAMKAEIAVESEEGQGTYCWIKIKSDSIIIDGDKTN